MNIIETRGLGRRYGGTWALQDCTLAIPAGSPGRAGRPERRRQDHAAEHRRRADRTDRRRASPCSAGSRPGRCRRWTASRSSPRTCRSTAHLVGGRHAAPDPQPQPRLRRRATRARAAAPTSGIAAEAARPGKLSGGQQAQLALTLALARHPRLLVLDEPTAPLDPLARHDFMATVMAAMADDGVSVVLSSHVLAELERVADYLVLISDGRVRLDGTVDDLPRGTGS